VATALEIIDRYPTLRSIYLLRSDITGASANPTEAQAAFFLLWAAVYGRKEYHGIVVDPQYLEFLTEPTGAYFSRLEFFVASTAKRTSSKIDAIHAWYYGNAIYELDLEVFLTAHERQRCKRWLKSNIDRLASPTPSTSGRHCRNLGVNLIGYADGVLGIGEDVRTLASILRYAGLPFAIFNIALSEHHATTEPSDLTSFFVDRPLFPINIFCATAFETERLRAERGPNLFSDRYNIGYWPWELSRLPSCWRHVFDAIDEVWAISHFLADVYIQHTNKPVTFVPPHVNVENVEPFDRKALSLDPDDFAFLTMLDFNSYIQRKNPVGTINAFKQAFPNVLGKERLVIKTINGHVHPTKLDELLDVINGDSRIVLMDGALSRTETSGLICDANCFVSLHRAEGFGRVIAEAMSLGTPVIATDYSGSATFLDRSNGFPIPYAMRDVGVGEYIFEEGSRWAEPDHQAAVQAFRKVRQETSLVAKRVAKAKKAITRNHGRDTVALKVIERLTQIAERSQPQPALAHAS
jgi:glycosyltransferase involved in cell wall biosynthesis